MQLNRRSLRIVLFLAIAALGAAGLLNTKNDDASAIDGRQVNAAERPFDHYLMALSWSPAYCATREPGSSSQQCGGGRDYHFILHGLWPQFERGWPSHCQAGERDPTRRAMANIRNVMPSDGLIHHQWDKHGTCSGLDSETYFEKARRAFGSFKTPAALSNMQRNERIDRNALLRALETANPELSRDAISLHCDGGRLREVRICTDPDTLRAMSCPTPPRGNCPREDITILAPQ